MQPYAGSQKLFHRAWIASGAGSLMNSTLAESEALNTVIRENTGCLSLKCLYRQTPEILMEAVPNSWVQSYYDLPPQVIKTFD